MGSRFNNVIMKKILIFLIAITFSTPLPILHAQEHGKEKPKVVKYYKPFQKLGRGMVNIISSPLEIPKQMYLQAIEGKTVWGTVARYIGGVFIGIGWTGYRFGAGVYDILTFPFPKLGDSIIEPEYVF